jgi:cell division protein FtsI (penicillin-binding protein 3)
MIAGNVIGYRQIDDEKGLNGLEAYYEELLKGREFVVEGFINNDQQISYKHGIPIDLKFEEGYSLKTTIDIRIQQIVERALEEQVKAMRAVSGTVIMMDPFTGDILALAQYPGYDPNEYQKTDPKLHTNRSVSHPSEPGSTIKPILVAAALNMGKVTENTILQGYGGSMMLGKYRITDHHKQKEFTTLEVIQHSSNIGAVQIAQRIGAENYYQYLKSFGLGEKTEVGLPNESRGYIRDYRTWGGIVGLGTHAYGYGFSATAMQMTQAMSVIANGGELIAPRLVSHFIEPTGKEIPIPIQIKQKVLSTEATKSTIKGLLMVTESGTAMKANIKGYKVAGKTGTANRVSGKGYNKDKVGASFIGFVPAEHPRYVMYVCIDEPNTESNFGGLISAPVFSRVGQEVLPYLGSMPTETIQEVKFSEDHVEGTDVAEVRSIYRPWWTKDRFLNNAPPETIVPDLAEANLAEVFEQADQLDLNLKIKGVGKVISQKPESGELVPDDRIVEVTLARADENDLSKWQVISDIPNSRYQDTKDSDAIEGLDEEGILLLQENEFQLPEQDIPQPDLPNPNQTAQPEGKLSEKDFDKPLAIDPKILKLDQEKKKAETQESKQPAPQESKQQVPQESKQPTPKPVHSSDSAIESLFENTPMPKIKSPTKPIKSTPQKPTPKPTPLKPTPLKPTPKPTPPKSTSIESLY